MSHQHDHLPLMHACSGCSSDGQIAKYIAFELDWRAVAEISCDTGVGGDVRTLVRIALSGRPKLEWTAARLNAPEIVWLYTLLSRLGRSCCIKWGPSSVVPRTSISRIPTVFRKALCMLPRNSAKKTQNRNGFQLDRRVPADQ